MRCLDMIRNAVSPLLLLAPLLVTILLLTPRIATSAPAQEHAALLHADQCDWTGSGGGGRGIRPVYLRCSRGTVSWRYPRGALRVVLSIGSTSISTNISKNLSRDEDVKMVKNSKTNQRSRESSRNPNRSEIRGFRGCVKVSGPIRVYLESSGSLRPIYSPRDGKHEASHRCFRSRKQTAALYVEADEPLTARDKARLQYDLEAYGARGAGPGESDEEAECRPCTMEELAEAYCRSDLVARGTVSAVQRKPDLEAAELVLRVTKTLRRVEDASTNEIGYDDPHTQKDIRVRVPATCDARHGQGEFVIMAKRRLGDLTLACAPRLETWAEAVRESESAPCVLTS